MRLICCCSQLRSKAAPTGGEQPLDTSPSSRPAARLPRLSVTDMAAHSLVSTPDRSSLTDPLPGASVAALVQPGVLVADESDDEDGEQTNLESSKINPLSVLEAVKTRIRRHLSQDRLFCQNETREQSAHRAEVKRLMHKRIRDELQTDSSEAVAETSTPPRVICRIATPLSNGPRDTIEFTMESNTERGLTATKALCHSLGSAEGEDQASSKAVMNQTSAQSAQEDGSPAVARAPVASKFCEVLNGQGEAGMEKSLKPLMISNSHLSIGMEAYHVDGHGTDIPRDQQHAEDGLSRDNLEVPAKNHVYSLSAHETSLSHFDKSVIPRRRRGFSSSEDGDETAEIWKRALEADSMARCGRRSVSNHTTVAQYELRQGRGHDQALPALKIDAPRTQTSSNSQEHSLTSNAVVKQEDDEVFRRSLEKSNNMLEDWSRQLNSPRPALGRENFALPSLCQPFIMTRRTPPASWSGFPSESRAARNAMAGEVDQVKSRDFAVVGLSHLGETIWITDKSSAHPKLRTNTRSFSDRFTQPFQKLGLSRLWAGRPRTPPKDKSIRGARRSSIRTSSDLEYPELEILPNVGGYEELRVIKEELNELRGLYTAAQSIPDPETVTLTRASLPKPLMPSLTQQDCSHEVEVPKAADVFAYRGTDASHPIFDFGCTSAPTIEIADPGITHCSSSSSQPFHSLQSSASSPRSLTPQSVLRRGMAVSHSKVTFDGGTLRNGTIPSLHTAATARGRRWDMWADEFNCRPASSQSSPY
ncbi:hypothetical protein BD289DRAFT_479616 [Coniella lustricola]|uniref:Uncharacterized protein n=1 Tax=Coniella lustricola TaxID=2025994 RepID=A0A2T3AIK1_9PEZI|nr:hypothetical protein BD289DRAFT_479616 [Coniella lustricola]